MIPYCERASSALIAEPFNTASNLAFLLAALWLWYRARHAKPGLRSHADTFLLIVLLACIGIGSLLWHTLAVTWTYWMDVIPILLFISVYLLSYLYRVVKPGTRWIIFWFLLYHVFNSGMQVLLPADMLNGSIFYLPTLVLLIVMTLYVRYLRHPAFITMSVACGVFCLSLLFRTLDTQLCALMPVGTHFLWHLLNAYVLFKLIQLQTEPGKF